MNQTVNLIKNHMSIRNYSDKKVTKDVVNTVIQCAQMASTSSHFQTYTIIEVQDKEKIEVLKKASGEQKMFDDAQLVLLFCGDLSRSGKYFENIDKDVLGNTESYTIATIDASLAAQNAIVCAESFGLGGVVVGGIRNDTAALYKEFLLPDLTFPLFALCFGYPNDVPGTKPRLPQEIVHKVNFYDDKKDDELIKEYNETVVNYYIERTDGKTKDRWTQRCGRLLMDKTREDVGIIFRKHGLLSR